MTSPKQPGPICWLASYPKSGNTWIRLFLSAYLNGRLDINRITHSCGDLQPYIYQSVLHKSVEECSAYELVCARQAAMNATVSLMYLDDPFVVKTHHANVLLDDLPLIQRPLTSRAIYVVRDPRDMAASYIRHMNVTADDAISQICNDHNVITNKYHLSHFLSDWSSHVRSWTQEKRFPVHIIRYERMLAESVRVFDDMLQFLGIQPDQEKIIEADERVSFKRLQQDEQEHGFKERPAKAERFFDVGRAGNYANVLTEEQIQRIESKHGEMMDEFGYRRISAAA